jgi:hypothetical protein
MRIVVYTANMVQNPDRDTPIDLPSNFVRIPGWDYVLITNLKNGKEIFKNSGWSKGEIRIMEPPEEEMPKKTVRGWQIYAARWCKWHPDNLFNNYDIAIWIDAWQIPDYNKIDKWLDIIKSFSNNEHKYDMVLDFHKKNKCIYEEHKSIVFCKKDTDISMLKVSKYIKVAGFPKDFGLYWTGCYVYKIGSKSIQKVLNNLWEDMLIYTYRDQALLTYEIWRNNKCDLWGTAPLNDIVIAVDTDINHEGYL